MHEISTLLIQEGNLDALLNVSNSSYSRGRDFIHNQRPSGNGFISIPPPHVAWHRQRGVALWCRTLKPVMLWRARLILMSIVDQTFALCNPRHSSHVLANCWA